MTNLNFIEDILSKSIISRDEIFSNVLFVNSNPAKIEITNVKKVNDKVEKTIENKTYELISNNIKISKISDHGLIWSISLFLDKQFMSLVKSNFCIDECEFYAPSFLKLFIKGKPQKIVDELWGCNWIITSKSTLKHLKRHKSFQSLSDDKATSIKLKGRIDNIFVFTTEDIEKDVIWKGNSLECSAVMLDNISIDFKDNIYDIKVDYLFNVKGIRKLTLI